MAKKGTENKVQSEQERIKEFVGKYEALCKEYGYMIQVTPAWRVSQDTNDWRLTLQSSVAKLPKEE